MKRAYQRFITVVDGFYDDPAAVRRRAEGLPYYRPVWLTGWRSNGAYYPADTRSRLERIVGLPIVAWRNDPEIGHGVFYKAYATGRRRERPTVHYDEPVNRVTALVYLTPGLPPDCGTSLWMHRATGLTDVPGPADAVRLGMTLEHLVRLLEKDSVNASKWIEIDRIGYAYNRLVCYPSGVLHSATRHYGSNDEDVRLYQSFRFGVDWSFRFANAGAVKGKRVAVRD